MCTEVLKSAEGQQVDKSSLQFNPYRTKVVVKMACQMPYAFSVTSIGSGTELTMHGTAGDWLIMGLKGELYPIRDEIFRIMCEPVEEKP
jgi:hypothetical protein